MRAFFILSTLFWVSLSHSYGAEAAATATPSIKELKKNFVRPKEIPSPDDNKYTKAREELGKMLFFDPRLSGSQIMSCATCHNPSFAWGDALPKGVGHGHKSLGRRTPTILNLAWAPRLFWDGRAGSLEEQALGPIASEGEMNMKLDNMVKRIGPIYKAYFEKAYPGEPLNEKTVGKALAVFQRGVISGTAPFDKWIAGNEKAISESAKRGFVLFNGKARCVNCHSGWNFTDHSFRDIGVADADIGRGEFMPQVPLFQHAFKTPTLRNVTQRGPYLHNGSEATLEDVVEFYNVGGKAKRPSLAPDIQPLNLTAQDKADLVEFMKTLTSVDKPVTMPVLPM